MSKSTEDAVRDAIEALHFSPKAAARRLVGSQSHTIALLVPALYAPSTTYGVWELGAEFVMGAASAAADRSYSLNVIPSSVGERELLEMYHSHLVDGVILMDIQPKDWRVDLLKSRELPFVTIGYPEDRTQVSYVSFDSPAAVSVMVTYLASLGHRRIGFLRPGLTQKEMGKARDLHTGATGAEPRWDQSAGGESFFAGLQSAYEGAAAASGLDSTIIRRRSFEPPDTVQAVEDVLKRVPELTAVVSWWSLGPAFLALQRLGLRVPQDISLIGVSNRRAVEWLHPPVTYVEFPTIRQGELAAGMLIRQLSSRARGERHSIEQVDIQPTLTIGNSTAPPAKTQ